MTRVVALVALVISIISLALNLILLQRLDQGRTAVADLLDRTSQQLGTLPDASFQYTVNISRTLSIAGEMPVHQSLTIPISTTLPIITSMNVNVDTPLGPMGVPVNVNTSVPINMNVPVTFSQTIPYSATVPLDMQVPIKIQLRDLGIEPAIIDAQNEIHRLRQALY